MRMILRIVGKLHKMCDAECSVRETVGAMFHFDRCDSHEQFQEKANAMLQFIELKHGMLICML